MNADALVCALHLYPDARSRAAGTNRTALIAGLRPGARASEATSAHGCTRRHRPTPGPEIGCERLGDTTTDPVVVAPLAQIDERCHDDAKRWVARGRSVSPVRYERPLSSRNNGAAEPRRARQAQPGPAEGACPPGPARRPPPPPGPERLRQMAEQVRHLVEDGAVPSRPQSRPRYRGRYLLGALQLEGGDSPSFRQDRVGFIRFADVCRSPPLCLQGAQGPWVRYSPIGVDSIDCDGDARRTGPSTRRHPGISSISGNAQR